MKMNRLKWMQAITIFLCSFFSSELIKLTGVKECVNKMSLIRRMTIEILILIGIMQLIWVIACYFIKIFYPSFYIKMKDETTRNHKSIG
jgi:hypothetical protein